MKKIFAIVLAATIVFAFSVVTAGAITLYPQYEISYGDTIEVEVPDSKVFPFSMVSFVPEESGYFALRSYSDYENDPYCDLYDGETAELLQSGDDENGLDFCLSYYFEAGKLYFFVISDFNGEAQFDISLGCAHSYIDRFCEFCGEECPHIAVSGNFGLCECGEVFSGIDVIEGESLELMFGEDVEKILRFTPEEDGAYIISSSSEVEDADPAADIYDEDYAYFDYADDEDGLNFVVMTELEAGKTYYIVIYNYSDFDYKFEVTVRKAVHDVLGGGTHELKYEPEIYSTCTEAGYTEGLYCEECEEFIFGHEEIPADEHWDWDRNGKCDICGAETEISYCSHICHSESSFLSFIWKIINFFNKIFGINAFCECGLYHFM